MKIALASDLHLEFGAVTLTNAENADVLVLAGDICVARDFELANANMYANRKRANTYTAFFEDVAAKFPQVVYIMGNHEHYSGDFKHTLDILRKAVAHLPNVHVLDKETFIVDGITLICGTLWTDMNGEDPLTIQNMPRMMNDFHGVHNSNNTVTRKVPIYDNENFETNREGYVVRNVIGHKFKEEPAKFTPSDAIKEHNHMLDYINHVTAELPEQKFVVVTHHAPSKLSCHPRFKHDTIMNGGFFTELGDFIAYRPQIKLWIHGHTHDEFDYTIGETRVVCNPRGYAGSEERARQFKLKYIEL